MSKESDSPDNENPLGGVEAGQGAWPVALRGVTESVVTTEGPDGRWNVAALGLHGSESITARTFGRTRTWRNFRERGGGYVQFTRDPVDFVEAALSVREADDPVLTSADAWARVEVTAQGEATVRGTHVVTWDLVPVETGVERETVPTIHRGHNAVVEATVAASRLSVESYDTEQLLDQLNRLAGVIDSCGGEREQVAYSRLQELVDAEW
jgi:hypothetical protein